MIGCLRTRVRKQPIIALYFESELVLKFYNLEAWFYDIVLCAPSKSLIISRRKENLLLYFNQSIACVSLFVCVRVSFLLGAMVDI